MVRSIALKVIGRPCTRARGSTRSANQSESYVVAGDPYRASRRACRLDPSPGVRWTSRNGSRRRPKQAGKPGAVLELKVANAGKKTLEQALAEGVTQILQRDYRSELRAARASRCMGSR